MKSKVKGQGGSKESLKETNTSEKVKTKASNNTVEASTENLHIAGAGVELEADMERVVIAGDGAEFETDVAEQAMDPERLQELLDAFTFPEPVHATVQLMPTLHWDFYIEPE